MNDSINNAIGFGIMTGYLAAMAAVVVMFFAH
jgi:hypothetical protein